MDKEKYVKRRVKVEIPIYVCLRCGGEWLPRLHLDNGEIVMKKPKVCRYCNSPYWDKKRKNHER